MMTIGKLFFSFFSIFVFSINTVWCQKTDGITFDTVCNGLTSHKVTVGDFTQTKKSSAVHRELKSSGHYIISGSGIVWETTKPFPSVLVVTETKIKQTLPDGTSSVIDGADNSVFASVAGTLSSLFSGDREKLEKNFTVCFLSSSDFWKMILYPKDANISSVMRSITLSGKSKSAVDTSLDSVLIDGVSNDTILYTFKNQQYKEALNEDEKALFTFS